jgi:hypothetical protein
MLTVCRIERSPPSWLRAVTPLAAGSRIWRLQSKDARTVINLRAYQGGSGGRQRARKAARYA